MHLRTFSLPAAYLGRGLVPFPGRAAGSRREIGAYERQLAHLGATTHQPESCENQALN